MDLETRKSLIDEHRAEIRKLEVEEAETQAVWPPPGYYMVWHVVIGMMLGSIGATVSLAANALGAPLFGERSLQLIRVYLTFPMGAQALEAETGLVVFATDSSAKRFLISTLLGPVLGRGVHASGLRLDDVPRRILGQVRAERGSLIPALGATQLVA